MVVFWLKTDVPNWSSRTAQTASEVAETVTWLGSAIARPLKRARTHARNDGFGWLVWDHHQEGEREHGETLFQARYSCLNRGLCTTRSRRAVQGQRPLAALRWLSEAHVPAYDTVLS